MAGLYRRDQTVRPKARQSKKDNKWSSINLLTGQFGCGLNYVSEKIHVNNKRFAPSFKLGLLCTAADIKYQ
jgi:hypothetical protein